MVRNWRVRSLSHSLHVKERKSVIHLWVLSALQLSCHSSQLSDSEFVLCLTSMRRRGRGGGDGGRGDGGRGGERRVHGPILSSPCLLETRGWWESTGDLTSEAQTLPLHYSKAALLHLLSGEREPGTATPTIIPVLRGQARRLRVTHAGWGSTCGQDMKWRQEDHEMRMWVYLKTNNNNKKKREKRNRIVLLICRLSFNLLAIKLIHLCICVSTNESPS